MKEKLTHQKDYIGGTETDLILSEFSSDSDNCEDDPCSAAFPKQKETSILLAIQAAVSQEDTLHSYLTHVLTVFRNSASAVVCRTLITVVSIFIFIIGVIKFRDCPYEQELPLFLVLEGLAIILKSTFSAVNSCQRRSKDENKRNTLDTCSDILSIFLALWTLTGTVWTFGVYSHVTIDTESRDCSKLVYRCSLWFLISLYGSVALLLVILAILSIYYKCTRTEGKNMNIPYEVRVDR